MKKEFFYISNLSYIFFALMLILMPAGLIGFGCLFIEDGKYIGIGTIVFLIWLIPLVLYYLCRYLKATFQGDDKAFDFRFRFKSENLHLDYKEIKKCELLNYPEHNRFGSLIGYKIHLQITDKENHEHVIRQYVSADYSFMDYPQGLPKEVKEAELTQIGNFIKSKLNPANLKKTEKKESPESETDTSVMYTNIADTPEIQEILKALRSKKYIKKIENEFTYDFIKEVYQQNLILTLTNDDTYYDNDDLKIRFENISDLESNLKGIMPPAFTILDHMSEGYSPETRYELIEDEWNILSFYFEKAEIMS